MLEYMANGIRIILVAYLFAVCGMMIDEPARTQEKSGLSSRPDAVFGFYTKVLVEAELKDTRSAVDYWMKRVGKRVGLEIEGRIYESLDSLRRDFQNGLIDWINISPSDYLKMKDDIEAELGPSPIMGGTINRRYLLIVKSNSSMKDVKDLRSKRLAATKDNEGGRIYLNTILWENRLEEIEDYFPEIIEKRTFAQAILAVFFGHADACVATDYAFDTLVKLNPQLQNELKVIAVSPSLVHSISIFRKSLDEGTRKIIENEVCNLDKTAEGGQVLTLFKIEGMVPVHSSDLDSFIEFYEKYLRLMPAKLRLAQIAESKIK